MGDPTKLSAVALAGALRSGELSAVSVMRAFLERIARLNPAVNAIVSMRRADELLAEAADADAVPRGERPPLHGIPFAVKDLTPVAGIPYTQGSPVYASRVPADDGVMASRLRAAGAIIIGMTNVPEFGLGSHTFNPLFGTTRNPYALERSAGGSSGGAAAALAARMVRIPARRRCGAAPSTRPDGEMHGRYPSPTAATRWARCVTPPHSATSTASGPRSASCLTCSTRRSLRQSESRRRRDQPRYESPHGRDTESGRRRGLTTLPDICAQGPMARDVADLALLLDVQCGPHADDPHAYGPPRPFSEAIADPCPGQAVAAPRVGYLGDFGGAYAYEAGIQDLCADALGVLRRLGAKVAEVTPRTRAETLWRAWTTWRSERQARAAASSSNSNNNNNTKGARAQAAGETGRLYADPSTRTKIKPEAVWEARRDRARSREMQRDCACTRRRWNAGRRSRPTI